MEIIDKRKRGGVYALNRKRKKERKKGRLILRRGRNKFSQKCCKFWQVRRYCKGKSVEFISAINFHSRKNYISQKMLYILINYIRKLKQGNIREGKEECILNRKKKKKDTRLISRHGR